MNTMAYGNDTIATKKARKRPNEIATTVYGPRNNVAMETAKGWPRAK